MKNTLISFRSACGAGGILNAPYLALAMAALGVVLSISVIVCPALAEEQQATAASAEQSPTAQAVEDEKREYFAIQQVTDAVDRASLLLAFSQKYPESPLLKPSDWEIIKNLSAKNLQNASEYAQLTLKSLDSAKQPDAKTRTEMQQIRLGCYQVIANDLIEKGQCADAISAFKKAMEIERSGGYYYDIGLCFDKQKQIDEAMLYYAMAELMGGQYAPKAKARLEMLYKALHNDTLVGIEKVYKQAKEQMAN